MDQIGYPYFYDQQKKRFLATVSGEFDPLKIKNTYLNILIREGFRSNPINIIWRCKDLTIPKSFQFGQAMENAQFSGPMASIGKTAVVIEPNSPNQRQIAIFYKGLANLELKREVKIFETIEEADAWLTC